jgi:hypothetical protein
MRFSYPRALGVRENDGDGVAGGLEGRDEGVDIWRALVGRRTIVICYLEDCWSVEMKGVTD